MKAAIPPSADHGDWKSLYRAAILETNTSAIPKLVSEAERAVISRKRELFGTMGTIEEKEALEDALYALSAYRSAWEHTEAA
jgi:hypothetical protein